MAFVKTPTTWIPNWAFTEPNITIPRASLPQLSAAEAHATTGDIRNINHAWLEQMWDTYKGLATADKPTQWTMTKSANVNTTTGETTNFYNIQIVTTTTGQEVAAEPSV